MDFSQLLAFLHWQNYVFLLIQPNIFRKKIDDNCKRNIFYRITIRIATNVRFSVRFYKEKCAKMQSFSFLQTRNELKAKQAKASRRTDVKLIKASNNQQLSCKK